MSTFGIIMLLIVWLSGAFAAWFTFFKKSDNDVFSKIIMSLPSWGIFVIVGIYELWQKLANK